MEQTNYNGALQRALGSGFGAKSTAAEVIRGIDLKGKVAIVTGGNSGIGLETVRTLAGAGAQVIVPARNVEKARANLKDLDRVEIHALDIMSPESIDAFAESFVNSGSALHLLVNNAGIMWVPLRRDGRGYESQLATNYLGMFHLTAKLWPALKKAKGARVVNVSSGGHQFSDFDFEDPNFNTRLYETLLGYGQSKTAVNLFSVEFDYRAKTHGVRSYSLCPGAVGGTDLSREAPMDLFQKLGYCDAEGNILPEVAASLKTLPQGASTTVWCAVSPMLDHIGGVYCENTDVADLSADLAMIGGVKTYSLDRGNALKLWELSEELLGFDFDVN
ncbi:SDR family NAD(P)-dependent oxidoreductase [Algoriphagus aestuariicola]|uniref:SDR family NAD(P)-dependent oxidoreductase n=1 Tax=Algoriphagus aestuariicola TaxID=1852016 RepID=A0ABS3BNQ7_9BACT|nr:SDR family NAD(P)-dependent oxidoreductase [Algoriphagus aestuariicola]MBN7800906.1 SDR family NAD(P)-dependent oxidoreductase [Algoriphagus aestuariicola]